MKKYIILTIICLSMFIFTGCGSSVDLNKYVSPSFSGEDGEGYADWDFDKSQFTEDCAKKVKFNSAQSAKYEEASMGEGLTGEDLAEWVYYEYINVDVSPSENLSNGDKVEFKWDCEDEIIEKVYGLKITHKDFTETVKGLDKSSGASAKSDDSDSEEQDEQADLKEVDPFDALTVKFEGADGSGTASIGSTHYEGVEYDIQPASGLTNGESVTVSVNSSDPFFEEHNMVPSVVEMEYTVEGLDSYAIAEDMINAGFREELNKWSSKAAIDEYQNCNASKLERLKYISLSNIFWVYDREYDEDGVKADGLIIANAKETSGEKKNIVYVLMEIPYKITVADDNSDHNSSKIGNVLGEGLIYECVEFENVRIEDGAPVLGDAKEVKLVKEFSDVEAMYNEIAGDYELVLKEEPSKQPSEEESSD